MIIDSVLDRISKEGMTLKEIVKFAGFNYCLKKGKFGYFLILSESQNEILNASFGQSLYEDLMQLDLDGIKKYFEINGSILKLKSFKSKGSKCFHKIYKMKTKSILKQNLLKPS